MITQEFRIRRARHACRKPSTCWRTRRAKPLAGGMSLIPLMKLRLAAPEQLIDIGRLQELNYIQREDGRPAHRRGHHALRRC